MTDRSPAASVEAIEEAKRLQHAHFGVEHLFIALIRLADSPGDRMFRGLGLDPVHVRDTIRAEAGTGKGSGTGRGLATNKAQAPTVARLLDELRKRTTR